jgi:hypothetical protein
MLRLKTKNNQKNGFQIHHFKEKFLHIITMKCQVTFDEFIYKKNKFKLIYTIINFHLNLDSSVLLASSIKF